MPKPRKVRMSDDEIYAMILAMCAAAGEDETVRPEDVAMTLHAVEWQALLKRVRLFAKQLAADGLIVILRKGKPVVDLGDAKGIIKLQIAPAFYALPETADSETE